MNELQAILADIEKKRQELAEAHRKLQQFKIELDEGFQKLRNMRLKVIKLTNAEGLDPRIRKIIEAAVND